MEYRQCDHCHSGVTTSWETYTTLCNQIPKETERLRKGAIHQCQFCQGFWYIDKDSIVIFLKDLDFVRAWAKAPQLINPEHLKTLKDIGSAPNYFDFFGNVIVKIPCKVEMLNGEIIDPAIICFRNHFEDNDEEYVSRHLVSEIKEIYPSEYALSRDVRVKLAFTPEWKIAFWPAIVKASDEKLFMLYDSPTEFFKHSVYKAKEISIFEYPNIQNFKQYYEEAEMVERIYPSLFLGDWQENFNDLIIASD